MNACAIRAARRTDGPGFLALVRALAEFEKLPGPTEEAAARLWEDAFGSRPRYRLLVAERDGGLVAYAVFFHTYSTFRAMPSLYLEDLFVHPTARRQGIAAALMQRLAALALEEGCGRFEWTVLDWNENARRFYTRLGARHLKEWEVWRAEGESLKNMATGDPGAG